jgi:hypothetical protein
MEEVKENVLREIATVCAEQFQDINQNIFASARKVYI